MHLSTPLRLALLVYVSVFLVGILLALGILLHAMPEVLTHTASDAVGALVAFLLARRGVSSWISIPVGLAALSVVVLALQILSPAEDFVWRLADALASGLIAVVMSLALVSYSRIEARRFRVLGSRRAPE